MLAAVVSRAARRRGATRRGKLTPAVSVGDDFVRPGHSAETKKQGEQKRHRQQNDKNLRRLREIVFGNERPRNPLVQKRRDIVADIEDEPDRDETRDAVEIGLEKIAQDIAIKQSHEEFWNLESRFAIQVTTSAKRLDCPIHKSQIANRQLREKIASPTDDSAELADTRKLSVSQFLIMIALRDSLGSDFVEEVRSLFSKNGSLAKAKNFEYRPQQQEMAVAVARALEEERHLVVEAGTGVGKSIAYLAPAILFAIAEKKKAVISTHTINLQEQLLYKDIPILKKILPIEFEAALMKGRQNYLCPRRLERAMQQAGELFTTSETAELARLADWAGTTKDGSLSDLAVEPDPKVWTQVCSEAHVCTAKTCGQNSNCFFQQARKRLLAADVIVLNHTLLFMLLGAPIEQEERESGYLFPNDFIIFDEAHTLEQTASRQIGIGVSQYGLRATIQRLYNARTRKGLFTVTRDATGVTLAAAIVDEIDRILSRDRRTLRFSKRPRVPCP